MKHTEKLLVLIYIGTFAGAGFVSGKEIWQFFGNFGIFGIIGLFVSLSIEPLISIIAILLSHKINDENFDTLVIKKNNKVLKIILKIFQFIFMFGVIIIMTSGASCLLNQITHLSKPICCLLFILILSLICYNGIKGIDKVLSVTIPFLIVFALFIGIYYLITNNFNFNFNVTPVRKFFMPNWIISAILFSGNNFFCGFSAILPVGVKIKSKKNIIIVFLFSTFLLLILALGVLLPQFITNNYEDVELPMINIAISINKSLGIIYSILLLLGMIGASTTRFFAIITSCQKYIPNVKNSKLFLFIIFSIPLFFLSLFGFGNLISVIYPICGYFGIISMIFITINYILEKKKDKISFNQNTTRL